MPIVIEPVPTPPAPSPSSAPSGFGSIPKLRLPLQLFRGRFATVEQDSDDELVQCVYAIAATPKETRLEYPELGVEDPTFDRIPINEAALLAAIAEWEPRAEVQTGQEVTESAERIRVGVGGGL